MRISVIIPSYNQAPYFRETLESVFSQDFPDLEVLVFDGGSMDGTVDLLREYDQKLKWVSRPDKGQTDAINQGLLQATGEIRCYLNSDDIFLPAALQKVHDYFEKNPDCEILYGDADHIFEPEKTLEPYPTEPWNYDRLFETCFLCQPAVFWRRSLNERYGFFDDTLQLAMDYEFWLRVGKHVSFHWLQGEKLAGSRMYADNKTHRLRLPAHEEFLRVTLRHAHACPVRWISVLSGMRLHDQRHGQGSWGDITAREALPEATKIAAEYDLILTDLELLRIKHLLPPD